MTATIPEPRSAAEPGPDQTGPGSGAVDLAKLPPPPDHGPDRTEAGPPDRSDRTALRRTADRTAELAWTTVRRTGAWTGRTARSAPRLADRWAWAICQRTANQLSSDRAEKMEFARSKKDVKGLEEQQAAHRAEAAERLAQGPDGLQLLMAWGAWLAVLVLAFATGLGWAIGPLPGWPLAVLLVLVCMGLAVRTWEPPVQTAERTADDGPSVRSELNAEELSTALADCGAIKKGSAVRLRRLRPEPADQGGGWSAEVEFPGTVTLSSVMAVREELAAGLDTGEANIVWEPVRGRAGRGRLWVADRDPLSLPPVRSPLMEMGATAVTEKVPLGADVHGHRVLASFIGTHWLIGGNTGAGKSMTGRTLVSGLAMKPDVQLIVADPQGLGIWSEFAQVGEYYEGGAEDPLVLEALTRRIEHLVGPEKARRRRIVAECRRAGTHNVRESKVTPEIVADRRLACPYLVLVLDEIQNYLNSPTHGVRLKAALMTFIKEFRAFGGTLIGLSQKPTDGAVPTDIRDIFTTRLCLQAPNTAFGTAILGEGFRSTGADPTGLILPEHQGAGYLWGMGGPGGPLSVLVRSDFMDDDDAAAVLRRARALRQAMRPELLPEVPTDDQEEPEAAQASQEPVWAILGDLLECFAPGEDFLPRQGLLDGLARLRPDAWAELTWGQLKERLDAADVAPDRARPAGGRNPVVGLRRTTITEALERLRPS
jgi:hypothetical protein